MFEAIKYIRITPETRRAAFLSFRNRDGKHWLIPVRNMKTGLEIYEPSGLKGKLVKKWLWLVSAVGCKGFGRFAFCNVELKEGLQALLHSIYHEYQFSIFGGTPSTDQKATIEIFRGKEILGYCKLGTSNRARALLHHEKDILNFLESRKVDHVPRCEGVFDLDGSAHVLIQTTEKRTGAKIEHGFGTKQRAFLHTLFEKTKQDILFEDTDFYRSILYLREKIQSLQLEYQNAAAQAVEAILLKYKGQHVLWGLCHRDFTPWNTCVTGGQLFVFDFEYALRSAPPEMDRWHFFVQTLQYEKKWNADRIAHEFLRKFPGQKDSFEMYLLDNMSLYLSRGNPADKEIANQRARILQQIRLMEESSNGRI